MVLAAGRGAGVPPGFLGRLTPVDAEHVWMPGPTVLCGKRQLRLIERDTESEAVALRCIAGRLRLFASSPGSYARICNGDHAQFEDHARPKTDI
jgi:hypothetical protein